MNRQIRPAMGCCPSCDSYQLLLSSGRLMDHNIPQPGVRHTEQVADPCPGSGDLPAPVGPLGIRLQ